jgi:peptidoglycan/LPS O-acetylase OafA/YrhL
LLRLPLEPGLQAQIVASATLTALGIQHGHEGSTHGAWSGRAIVAILIAWASLMYPPLIIVGLAALTYIVVYIGMCKIYLPAFLLKGDYSYGVYLFGFPIQQTLVYFLPPEYRNGVVILLLGLPLTLAFAITSWNLVEKPILRLKNKFMP